MSKLLKHIAKEEEHDFTLATNDFFRADLKHIGNSIFEIRRHFIFEDDRTVTPRNLDNSLANVKDCLLRLAQKHAFVLGLDTRTDKEVDNTNHPKTEPCFMFLSETLSVALDFTTSPRPGNSVCDVFIVFPTKPTMVLSLVDGDEQSREALAYNTSVARGVRHKLIRFMDEDVNSIHGVINTSTLKGSVAFNTRLKVLADDSSHFVPMRSLLMNPRRYDRVLTAFWAGVAETKSVLRENGEGDNCIRFLTKEQCIVLVENINSKDVKVRCMPGSGATTLMLEVARRLSRLGDTLLVCRSQKERDRLRSAYASVVSVNDLSKLDLSSYVNIVDETNSVTPETRRHHWQFASYLTDIKDLKYRKWIVEREIDRTEKLKDSLTNDQWSRSRKYLEGDFDVLTLLSGTLRQNIVVQQNKLENKPREPARDNILTHPGPSREGDEKMKDSPQSSESKFWNQQNTCTARAIQESSDDAKDGWKLQHRYNVEAEGHPEKIPEQNAKNKTGSSSAEKLNDIHTEDRPELQDTDVGEAESRTQEIESLNEELGSLKSNRYHITRQLDQLQTDVNLDIKDDVLGYMEGLCLSKVEPPGLDSVSNYRREEEDQDESNLQRRMTHRRKTDFTKDSKQKVMTEDEQRLADLTVKNASLEKVNLDIKDDVVGYMEGLYLSKVEQPGLDSVSNYRREEEDQDESNLQRRMTHRQNTDFTKDSKQKVMTEDEQRLADLTVKNASLEKVNLDIKDDVLGYMEGLYLSKVEPPGLDSVSNYRREEEDQDESNLQRRMTHRQNTDFTKDSKQKFSGATSKLVVVEREAGYTAKDGCHSPYRSTGLIHLLRRYQHGSLKERDLTTLTFKVMAEDEQRLAENASLERDFGSTVHIVGVQCRPAAISCPKRHLDAARANTRCCHVTTDGELVNSPPDTWDEGRNRLHMYWGTCSSPILPPPSPSTPTPYPATPTYWESKTRVRVGVARLRCYVLEMGVCEAGQVDSALCVSRQRRSWCVSVESCDRHRGSFCTTVWREEERGDCHQNTMSRTPGTQATLHYGVMLDVGRGRVAFIDLDRGIVLGKCDEVFRETLVPVFSVGWPPSGHTTSMSLISGEDVDMTDIKRALVYQALR